MTDSESDNPDSYCEMKNILSENGKRLIQKKHRTIRRRAQRLKSRTTAEQRFLSRQVSSHVSKIENVQTLEQLLRSLFRKKMWEQMLGGGQVC